MINVPPYYDDRKKVDASSAQSLVDDPSLTFSEKITYGRRQIPKAVKATGAYQDKIERAVSSVGKQFGISDSKKGVARRAVGTRNLLASVGVVPSSSTSRVGRGRPKGTYKYGIPIQQYKKLQSERRALYQQYAQQQEQRLAGRGFTPQQVQQIQVARTVSQPQQMQQLPDNATDELQFQKYLAENTISPNTQAILDNLKRIQNKSITDDINMQRIVRERKLVNSQQSLLKARPLFGPDSNKMNIFDEEFNILKAPNVFSQQSGINILQTGRTHILDTKSTGNQLRFF